MSRVFVNGQEQEMAGQTFEAPGFMKRRDGTRARVTVPEDDRSLERMHRAARSVLDAFELPDLSGFTDAQRVALALLREITHDTGGL